MRLHLINRYNNPMSIPLLYACSLIWFTEKYALDKQQKKKTMRKSMMKIPTLPTKAPNQAKLNAQQVPNVFSEIFGSRQLLI